MLWLKQSTVVTVQLGPFVDKTDGVAPETGLAAAMDNATTGIRVSKNGAVAIDRNSATVPAHDVDGYYRVALSATDTNTLGALHIQYEELATCLPAWKEFMVVPANVWDSFFGADQLEVDQVEIKGTTVPTPTTAGVPDVNVERWIDTLVTLGAGAPDVNVATQDAAALTAIEDEIWDALKSAHVVANSFGDFLDIEVSGRSAPATAQTIAANQNVNVNQWLTAAAPALVGSRLDVSIGAMAANVLTAAAINANAITAAKINAAALDGKGNWNIGKTGYTAGPTAGSFTTAAWAAGAINAAAIAANAIEAGKIAAAALNGKGDWNMGKTGYTAAPTAASIAAGSFAAGAIDANALATDAVAEIARAILPQINIAFSDIEFLFVAASDHVTPVTAASTMTVTRSINGGAFGAGTGTIAEVGNGIYQYDASAADMNGAIITFRFAATGGTPGAPDDRFLTIMTAA